MKKLTPVLLLIGIAFIFVGLMWWDKHSLPPEASQSSVKAQQSAIATKLHDEMLYAQHAPELRFQPPLPAPAFDLALLKGSIVILNFWASWCPPCLEEIPSFITLLTTAQQRKLPIVLIAVNNDASEQAMLDFIKTYNTKNKQAFEHPLMRVVHDHEHHFTQDIFHTLRYPETIIIAPNGMMVRKIIGGDFDWNSTTMLDYFEALAQQEKTIAK